MCYTLGRQDGMYPILVLVLANGNSMERGKISQPDLDQWWLIEMMEKQIETVEIHLANLQVMDIDDVNKEIGQQD